MDNQSNIPNAPKTVHDIGAPSRLGSIPVQHCQDVKHQAVFMHISSASFLF